MAEEAENKVDEPASIVLDDGQSMPSLSNALRTAAVTDSLSLTIQTSIAYPPSRFAMKLQCLRCARWQFGGNHGLKLREQGEMRLWLSQAGTLQT